MFRMTRRFLGLALAAGCVLFPLAACGEGGPPSVFNNDNQVATILNADGSTTSVRPQHTQRVGPGAVLVIPPRLSCTWHTGTPYGAPKIIGPAARLPIDRPVYLEGCLPQQ